MRIKHVLLVVFAVALQGFAATAALPNRISVEQLERILAAGKAGGDAELARQLSALELTERLSTARFEQLKVELPGEKSQLALTALADLSLFLEPPANEIPATAAPDVTSQRRMLAQTVHYLAKTLPLLPNLFATRDILRFENRALFSGAEEENPLRAVDRSAVTVFYRDGQEFVETGKTRNGKQRLPDKGLTTWGEFGPILGIVVMDASRSRLEWSHWELSSGGPQAVFRYSVPKEKSHYDVRFCCVSEAYGMEVNFLTQRTGYHGEITLNPDSGTILRLTVISDFDRENPIEHASVLVEYGPEEIGGKTYICPVRGLALARAPDMKAVSEALAQRRSVGPENLKASMEKTSLTSLSNGPRQILLNDETFRQYHMYRTEVKILTEKEAASRLAASAASPSAAKPAAENEKPAEEAAAEPSPASAQPAAEAAAAPASEMLSAPPPAPEIPEVYVAPAIGLPEAPTIPAMSGSATGAIFRINARLVDVPLVVLDKKGHPLSNFNPGDLEVYDNGVKVDVRAFSPAGGTAAAPASTQVKAPESQERPQFSNRNAGPANATGGEVPNTLVLLIDSTLSMDDLSNVREQMERFLKGLRENERAAIYVMRRGGFQVLQDTSTNHQHIADVLAKWIPSADSLSLGQEQEARNRQQMDYVHNVEDLVQVNGNEVTDTEAQTRSLDPKLRELGDNPGGDALSILVLVARHLAAIPGHKNLVWIASDNVLADWNNSALDMQKGSHNIEPAALHVQEAMNDAHVSVYPLDASRLEGGMIGANIAAMNVQLSPTATANQIPAAVGGGCGRVNGGIAGSIGGYDPVLTAGPDINTCNNSLNPGRMTAQMLQDVHSIQGVYREIADATGGEAFRRASDIVGELNHVADDGRATYMLSFAPALAADGKYHIITIKLAGHKDARIRYRTGYFYRQEPSTLKDRFREAALEPENAAEIGLTANVVPGSSGRTVKLGITAADLEIAQQGSLWTDKLDIYLVQREVSGRKAQIIGQSMSLRMRSGTYQKYLQDGIPFDQVVEVAPGMGSIRIIVLDENSGRMGSVTIPVAALGKQS